MKPKKELEEKGYAIIENIYSEKEISQIISCLENAKQNEKLEVKTKEVFAIRQLLQNVPTLSNFLWNTKLKELLSNLFASEYFLTKAIYFDKPSTSNWFVPYHQDISISVDKKVEVDNYTHWTFKKGQYGVQPPVTILENTITVRIHLDYTNKENGALKVIPKSHTKGIIKINSNEWDKEEEFIGEVNKGGVMLMKPLTLHASNRTTNSKQRRVIHLEFNTHFLAKPLTWLEYYAISPLI